MQTYYYVVYSNPVEGREEEYNAWYSNVHIVDALKIPGIVAARRFRLAGAQRFGPPYPWKYMALYEFETDTPEETLRILKERSGSPEMVVSDAFGPGHIGFVFEPITPRLRSEQVR